MSDTEDAIPERPATWENVVAGEVKKAVGHLVGDHEYVEEGAEQIEKAHELHQEFDEEHGH